MKNKFNQQDSFETIQTMIGNAKIKFKEKGELFILWGWLSFSASLLHFILLYFQLVDVKYAWIVWPVMSVIGLFFQVRYIKSKEKQQSSVTYFDITMKFLWIGISFLYFFTLVLVISGQINWVSATAIFIAIFGMGSFITGGILKFKPLILGGIVAIIIAVGTSFAPYLYIFPLMAASMLAGYLIPGYMLKKSNSSTIS